MDTPTPPLSRSVEDYLKAIYGLTESGDPASTSAVAQVLEVQPASVTGMVKRLAESELVEHVPYRGVRLTARGSREALKILRRHRIIESYLCQRLGYSWDDVHDEAERMEHAVSDTLIERMAAALEFPSHDPHGAPIPTPTGEIESTDFSTLADVPPGAEVWVRAVRDEDPTRLRSMEAKGLMPGARVVVSPEQATEGALAVRVGRGAGTSRSVEEELARLIFVVTDES